MNAPCHTMAAKKSETARPLFMMRVERLVLHGSQLEVAGVLTGVAVVVRGGMDARRHLGLGQPGPERVVDGVGR